MALTLTNAQVVARLKTLALHHLKADSGSTTTAVNSELSDEADLTTNYICFINGDNEGTDRIITDFDDTTGTMTFSALDNAVTSTDEFCILSTGFQSDVIQAVQFMRNHFRNMGYDLDLFLTYSQLEEVHIFKTLEIICANKANDAVDSDIWWFHYNRFKDLYNSEIATLIADYDINEDGTIQESEENQDVGRSGFLSR